MQSADFLHRMERVLAKRVEAKKAEESRPARRLVRAGGIVVGTLVCFFVLKAAALAHGGAVFAGPLPAGAGLAAQVHHWFVGVDPFTATLAHALRPAAQPAAETL